ncbi:mtDNA inheritance, partitioning of the mitochondrial organelle [Maublancomyces gigas]|uniref:MtDNA inheritance, partitioning of the mitochondrial organelle n=1 Tax=Discina gigas TaxID=1032678 RepID=A0ABR3GWV2_9PEZI
MHEIITLQLGHQANYLGTHFWNTQESYFTYTEDATLSPVDHDVHFRPGIGVGGIETYTPRSLIYDLKGGFGSMRKINALYDQMEETAGGMPQGLWDRGTTVQREPLIEPIEYQRNLDAGLPAPSLDTPAVRYWSDFNKVFYHPRSSIQINEYELNSKVVPFKGFGLGRDLFHQLDKEHDLLDRDFRLFAEECDQMQGVQIIMSTDDAWGGFGSEYVAALRDEYSKIAIVTWGLESGDKVPREQDIKRTVDLAYSLSGIVPLTSLYIPLRSPLPRLPSYVTMDSTSKWHAMGLLSVAMETCTLPTRIRDNDSTGFLGRFDDMVTLLNVSGNQKIANLAMSIHQTETEEKAYDYPSLMPLPQRVSAPKVELSWESGGTGVGGRKIDNKGHIFAEAEVLRGFSEEQAMEITASSSRAHQKTDQRTAQRKAQLEHDRQDAIIGRYLTPFTYPIVDSFPNIFAESVLDTSALERPCVSRISTTLTTSSRIISRLKDVKNVVSRVIGVDEREALLNDLGEFAEAYEEGWNSGSDDDDD